MTTRYSSALPQIHQGSPEGSFIFLAKEAKRLRGQAEGLSLCEELEAWQEGSLDCLHDATYDAEDQTRTMSGRDCRVTREHTDVSKAHSLPESSSRLPQPLLPSLPPLPTEDT